MKLKILTTAFWKTIFGLKVTSPEAPEKLLRPKHTSREQIPASQPSKTEPPNEFQEIEREEPPEPKPARAAREETLTESQIRKKGESLIVRSELNLEQNSIFTVSTYRGKSREIVTREIGPVGEVYEHRAIIGRTAGGAETGVLTTYHFKVYLALLELWEKAGRPINEPVHFTILKIIKRLGLSHDGRTYARMKRWLLDLGQVPLTFINSFFVSEESVHQTLDPFHVLGYLTIYERKKVGKQHKTYGYGKFRFDDHILENLISNYSHPLRLDVITGFKKHRDLAILLYTYVDRNLAFKDKYEIGLEKLYEHLDLSQDYVKYPSYRKAKIEPVLEQLRGKELSTGILSYAQIQKTKDGKDYKLVCRKKPFPKKLREQETLPQLELTLPTKTESGSESTETKPESAKSSSELLPLLIEKGLTQKQVAKLVAEKSPEVISDQLEYLPFRVKEYGSQGKEINQPAILYDSINDNWKAPKGYIGAQKEKEREARQLEQERIAQLEREEQDRAEQEREEIEAYKESLSPEERAVLRERALEEIRSMEGVKEDFIGDVLVEFKENEIVRREAL